MKKYILSLFIVLICIYNSNSQTTATDFTMNDCNGQMHHLFSELDSGNVVILEFFMLSCTPCITAGQKLEALHQTLTTQYGSSKVRYYHFGYSNSYTCTQITNWVSTNGFSSVPFDSGAAQVAYYGGMGMPTVAVVAGSAHSVLFTNVGFATSDTGTIGTAVRNFFKASGVNEPAHPALSANTIYNPTSETLAISLNTYSSGALDIELINVTGQKVKTLTHKELINGGLHNKTFPVQLPAGIYFINIRFNEESVSQKIVIQK